MELWTFKFPSHDALASYVYTFESRYLLVRDGGIYITIDAWDGNTPIIITGGARHRGVRVHLPQPAAVPVPTQQPKVDKSAWSTQVGGEHYSSMRIQPFQFSMLNGLDPMQHTVIKYVTRFRSKNGIEDLEKAKHTIDLLIQFEKDKNATTPR